MVGALVVVGALAPIGGLLAVSGAASDTVARGRPVPLPDAPVGAPGAVVTPLLSARRVPSVLIGFDPTATLRAKLHALDAALPAPSCYVVHAGGEVIGGLRADQAVLPASNLKLVTASVALESLGPETRFSTRLVGTAPLAATVEGDLTLVGGGDPLLTTDDYVAGLRNDAHYVATDWTRLEVLADEVAVAGVKVITGAIVGDESRYDALRSVATWPASYQADPQAGPLSALLLNDGFTTYRGDNHGTVTRDPAAHTAATLTALLGQRGVTVRGVARHGVAPAGATDVVTALSSVPMTAVVAEMLEMSDNDTAELLLKELGHAATGSGTTASGVAVVATRLAALGVPTTGFVQLDGSGLDRGDRVTCALLTGLLDRAVPDGVLLKGLPVAGQSGTLSDVFVGTAVAGRLLGKTGTLTGARSLSGVLPAPPVAPLVFSWIYNGPTDRDALWLGARSAFVSALASYPDRVDLTPYLPAPGRPAS